MAEIAGRRSHGNRVQVKVRLPKDVKAKLDAHAEAAGVSLSTIIQVALGKAVAEWRSTRECGDCGGRGCHPCGGVGRVRV